MTIRDLGYRPYDGVRLPPSNNAWVLLRVGLRRAWASWLVKIAAFFGVAPALIGMALVVGGRMVMRQMSGDETVDPVRVVEAMRRLYSVQMWLFVSMVTLGAGASAIAEDLQHRAFQFYFAKPVTPAQYLAGRTFALAIWLFGLTFVPAVLLDLALVGTARSADVVEQLGLLVPALAFSTLIAVVLAPTSIAMSALSKSRALTMSAWVVVWIVPQALAGVVDRVARAAGSEDGWPWLYLVSLTGLLGHAGDLIFNVESDVDARIRYAGLGVLAAITVSAVWLSLSRLRRAEVIT